MEKNRTAHVRAAETARWTTGTYTELRRVAAGTLALERRAHTLAPTELVHEAWLKLRGSALPDSAARVALAAHAMREILVDHARRRNALKRGDGRRPEALSEAMYASARAEERDAYLVALDEALHELSDVDPELARLVELRFFAGLDTDGVARTLALSPRTVKRRWQLAKGWLHRSITGPRSITGARSGDTRGPA